MTFNYRMYAESLLGEFRNIHEEIAEATETESQFRKELRQMKQLQENAEQEVIVSKPPKEWGSNAEDRKVNQAVSQRRDANCARYARLTDEAEEALRKAEDNKAALATKFTALRYQSNLIVALLGNAATEETLESQLG